MAWRNEQVSEGETARILEVARECLAISGDFAEFGCYKGDTALLLAEVLDEAKEARLKVPVTEVEAVEKPVEKSLGRRLWIYDSFEGLPKKTEADLSALGENFREGELFVTKREVKERFLRAGLPVPVIRKGWFSDLTEADLPERLAFSFLDGDFYESIRDSLRLITGRVSPGGAIIVHDYSNPALPGVKKAVDEWMAGKDFRTEVYQSLIVISTRGL